MLDTGHRHYRWLRSKIRPPALVPPAITVGGFGAWLSVLPLNDRPDGIAYLTALKPRYLIENKETSVRVENVTTGMRRTDDGREHVFREHRVHQFSPNDSPSAVQGVELPREFLNGLTEQTYKGTLATWARFTDRATGTRWEVAFGAATGAQPTYTVTADDPTL